MKGSVETALVCSGDAVVSHLSVSCWHVGPLGSGGSEQDAFLQALALGAAGDPRAARSRVGFFLISRALTLLLAFSHQSKQHRLSPEVSLLTNVALPRETRMASFGMLVVQAELVKCCRGTSWEQTDIEAGTCPALQGYVGGGGVSPHLQYDKPSHEGRVLVLGQQWGWTCCPDRGMLLLLVVKAVMMVVSRW